MSTLIVTQSRTVIGCGIETNGAILYYDISNPLSYTSPATITNNLAFQNPTWTGSLVGSPTYNVTYPQSLTLNGSTQYVTCTEAYLGPSFTAIAVVKSSSPTWNTNNSNIFGGNSSTAVGAPFNESGFTMYPPTLGATTVNFVMSDSRYGPQATLVGTITPSNIDVPTFYYLSFDAYPLPNIGGVLKYGYNDFIYTDPNTNNYSRYLTNQMNLYIGASDTGTNPLDMTVYSAILYNRAFEDWEISQTYQAMKRKYGIPD